MRILIVQTSFLGDVVLSTPTFAAIRRHFPDAYIAVLVRPESVGILAGHPAIDEVLSDDKRGETRGLGTFATIRKLRQQHFDLVVSLHKSFRTAWLLAASGIPQRLGFRESAGWFLFHRTTRRDKALHEVKRNLAILRCFDLDPAAHVTRPFVACTSAGIEGFEKIMASHGIGKEHPVIGIAPGSAWATKRWTVDGFASLLRGIQSDLGATPILLGAKGDAAYAAEVQSAAGGAGINLVGRTDLAVLTAAIDRSSVLVTNDSAPMHIAVARSTPLVAIFGPTTPSMGFGPFAPDAIVIERDLSCRPCSRHGTATCPIGTHACMKEISPSEVLVAVRRLLPTNTTVLASSSGGARC